MSAPSRLKKMVVFRCPECGEVERAEAGQRRWVRSWDGSVTHYHPGEKPHWPGTKVKAEEVEVIPVVRAEELEAERDHVAAEAADRATTLEDLAALITPGGPQPDYEAVAESLTQIASDLERLGSKDFSGGNSIGRGPTVPSGAAGRSGFDTRSPLKSSLTDDDRERLRGLAGELEHLPAEFRRHFDQDGRDARFLRILAAKGENPESTEEGT